MVNCFNLHEQWENRSSQDYIEKKGHDMIKQKNHFHVPDLDRRRSRSNSIQSDLIWLAQGGILQASFDYPNFFVEKY